MKTISISACSVPAVRPSNLRLVRAVSLLATVGVFSASLLAQTATPPDANADARARRRTQNADANGNANGNANAGRGNFDPAAMQERQMTFLREQFAVTDDAEWTLIAERITKVSEIRRSTLGGGGFGRGATQGGGGGGGNRPTRATANPEQDALRTALTDKLPDAEIKSRLARLRDVRKENETKLTKAQEDLRAVLTLRQEAIAVMAGLLP